MSKQVRSLKTRSAILVATFLSTVCLLSVPVIAFDGTHNSDVQAESAIAAQQNAETQLIPEKTWLFAVGILTFSDNVSWDSRYRRDTQLVSLFRKRGLPSDHISYIKDRDGTLANIKTAFASFLDGPQPGDFLIHYYTGHGGDGVFETTNGGSYNHSWIAKQIADKFHGTQVLLLGDCCDSGSLQDVVNNASGPIAVACLSSSSRTESGNGRWTFSQAVLDGLRGEPYVDLNHDGNITIDEIAAHVKHDILFYERNHSIYRKTANFNGNMIVAKTKSTNVQEPQPVQVLYHSKWWKAKLMERRGDQGRIRWIQLGYDSPDQDIWVDLDTIRPLTRPW
jgi:hypothetical protein